MNDKPEFCWVWSTEDSVLEVRDYKPEFASGLFKQFLVTRNEAGEVIKLERVEG